MIEECACGERRGWVPAGARTADAGLAWPAPLAEEALRVWRAGMHAGRPGQVCGQSRARGCVSCLHVQGLTAARAWQPHTCSAAVRPCRAPTLCRAGAALDAARARTCGPCCAHNLTLYSRIDIHCSHAHRCQVSCLLAQGERRVAGCLVWCWQLFPFAAWAVLAQGRTLAS